MKRQRHEYSYNGPVMSFDICVERSWKVTTFAPTKKKALSNLAFRYKRDHNLAKNANISLDENKLVRED